MSELAIVIPAYKDIFFERTLISISNQTCKDFTVYVGDDAGSENIKLLCDKYDKDLKLIYKRFEDNLGKTDLIGQWERCIDLIKDEKWIWLFSDDDIMDINCVEEFFKTIKKNPEFDLYHFNVDLIDEFDKKITDSLHFPEIFPVEEFISYRLEGRLYTFVVEYIFKKDTFIKSGKFQKFDLAWGSDDATWIKLGKSKGIFTIENALIHWRRSTHNITPNVENYDILKRKTDAQIDFTKWIINFSKTHKLKIDDKILINKLKTWFLKQFANNILIYPKEHQKEILVKFHSIPGLKKSKTMIILHLFYYQFLARYGLFKVYIRDHLNV